MSAKIVCGLIGLVLAGPIGLLVGILLGHVIDRSSSAQGQGKSGWSRFRRTPVKDIQSTFFECTFKVMGHLAKSDGWVSEKDIQIARTIMNNLGLDAENKRLAIDFFTAGKQSDFNLDETLGKLKLVCWHQPALLQIFLETQIRMAYANEQISPSKRTLLQHICKQLGISGLHFNFFEQQYGYQSSHSSSRGSIPRNELDEAYQLLSLKPSASVAEIKKAYRKRMSENHPDRLIAKGLPQGMIKIATEKTQKIKQAYETIRQTKGF